MKQLHTLLVATVLLFSWSGLAASPPGAQSVVIEVMNPGRISKTTIIQVKENDIWKDVPYQRQEQLFTIVLSDEADSIYMSSGPSFALERIDRYGIINHGLIYLYLRNRGESFVDVNNCEVPVIWYPREFVILPADPLAEQELFMKELMQKYPGYSIYPWDDFAILMTIPGSLHLQTELNRLQNDPSVKSLHAVAQFEGGDPTFAYADFSARLDYRLSYDIVRQIISEYGFTFDSVVFGTGNLYSIKSDTRLIDASWFERIHLLANDPRVSGVDISWYSKITFDKD